MDQGIYIWTASSKFGTYHLCEQQRFRRACASAQSRQNLRCSLIQAVSQEEPSNRKRDPWLLWMAGHAQLKFVMTECSKTRIRLTGLIRRKATDVIGAWIILVIAYTKTLNRFNSVLKFICTVWAFTVHNKMLITLLFFQEEEPLAINYSIIKQ